MAIAKNEVADIVLFTGDVPKKYHIRSYFTYGSDQHRVKKTHGYIHNPESIKGMFFTVLTK